MQRGGAVCTPVIPLATSIPITDDNKLRRKIVRDVSRVLYLTQALQEWPNQSVSRDG